MKILLLLTLAVVAAASARAADPLEAFPPAEPGMTRFVIRVPKVGNETGHRVELIVGKIA